MFKRLLLIFLLSLFCLSNAFAISGLELAQQVYDREDGDDAHFLTKMVLIDKNGYERKRIFKSYAKDYDGLMKSYLEFMEPPDIEGTKFLSREHADKDDTQYLYLPELGRSRRIVSSQKKELRTSFRSAIHATDSTWRGWRANAAATKALCQRALVILLRTPNRSKVLAMWMIRFIR